MVKDLKPGGVEGNTAAILTSQLCTEISKNKDYEVVCAEDLKSIIEHRALEINLSGCNDEDCLTNIGKSIKADFMVTGSIGKIENVFVLQLQFIELTTGSVLNSISDKTEKGLKKFLDELPALTEKLMDLEEGSKT